MFCMCLSTRIAIVAGQSHSNEEQVAMFEDIWVLDREGFTEKPYSNISSGSEYPIKTTNILQIKEIIADQIEPFVRGAAIIRKGNAVALINSLGEFIIPFNKYGYIFYAENQRETRSKHAHERNGIFVVSEGKNGLKGGLINSTGKFIFQGNYESIVESNEKYVRLVSTDFASKKLPPPHYSIIIDYNGKILKFSEAERIELEDISENVIRYKTSYPFKFGFKYLNGNIITKPIFDGASVFSDGLAAVKQSNEFGEQKWGFIDRSGKVVIGLKYSNRPKDFGNGISIIQPADQSSYEFILINKKGNDVFKFDKIKGNSLSFDENKFTNGFIRDYNELIDTLGNKYDAKFFLNKFQVDSDLDVNFSSRYKNKVFVSRPTGRSSTTFFGTRSKEDIGCLDLESGQCILPQFEELSHFDSWSGLAYAKKYLSTDENTRENLYTEGYINNKGEFLIIMKKPDKY